jgi:hypothetical protein
VATAAWTRKEGKNPSGGLNAKGRASYKGGTLKAPSKVGTVRCLHLLLYLYLQLLVK